MEMKRGGLSRHLWPCLMLLLVACGGATPAVTTSVPRVDPSSTRLASAALQATSPMPVVSPLPQIQTVFVIVMENHNWADIKGNSSAPYINGTLLPTAAHAERYYNPPGVHPSLPNYLWLEAGTDFGVADDRPPSAHHQRTADHLVTQLVRAGISWKTYQEGIDGTTCPLINVDRYVPKHNPMVYFDDVTGGNDPHDANCIAHMRPYAELATDLGNDTTARYNFIAPDLCHDMHDTCAPLQDAVRQGDAWLAATVPQILASPAYRRGGALFITWDEGEGGDGPIGMIVVSPFAKSGGYQNTIRYTHSSTLATLQRIFGVGPALGGAATATDLRDLFAATVPPPTPRTGEPARDPQGRGGP